VARLWLSLAGVLSTCEPIPAINADGKFLSRLGDKFFFKAMRLSAIDGPMDFGRMLALRKRLDELKQAHTTGVVLTYAQAEPALGLAAQAGLYGLVELEVHPEELLSSAGFRSATRRLASAALVLREHPSLIGYLIDCPIDPDTLRERGFKRIRRRLSTLVDTLRRRDRRKLVALKHRPATCGLALLEEDFIYASLPALDPGELREYVIRLHNVAEARPLIIEFVEGLPGQDELVACAVGLGTAGVVAPAMRPAASIGGLGIRVLSAGEFLPFVMLNGSCPPMPSELPMVSVVICAYNAERTMRACLQSLRKLDYPNYEVVVVDDGSRDRTAEIAAEFPEFRLIRQANKGLSIARNVGMHAALGELVAYTDSDCVVDPHWLAFLVRTMIEKRFDGCGGPNYAPHEDGWVEGCVAASPGAPCHVLTANDRAEHLAGCNMIFRKVALLEIGAFDPQFTSAGDDVDICWRLLDAGFSLGFCPAAFVWHFRRNTVKAYYGQQRGYGRAEAALYLKYPERFNALGQVKWCGTIPGLARTVPGGSATQVAWSRDHVQLQQVRESQLSVFKVLPSTLEWNLASIVALVVSVSAGFTPLPALAMLLTSPLWALHYAFKAPLERCHEGMQSRLFVALLAYTGPMARTMARYRRRFGVGQRRLFDVPPRQRPQVEWIRRTMRLSYWNETWTTRDSLIERLAHFHARLGMPVLGHSGWSDFDLAVRTEPLTRIEFKTADEEHGGMRLKTHVAARIRLNPLAGLALGAGAVLTAAATVASLGTVAFALGALTFAAAVCSASEVVRSGRLAYRVIEQCAAELNLTPLGEPSREVGPAAAAIPERPQSSVEAYPAGR
jgi:glycosyltransferase involved in cell wall biosynthesis